jgi:hypothetical protein
VDASLLAEAVAELSAPMVPFLSDPSLFLVRAMVHSPSVAQPSFGGAGFALLSHSVWVGSLSYLSGIMVLWVISCWVFRCCRLGRCSPWLLGAPLNFCLECLGGSNNLLMSSRWL